MLSQSVMPVLSAEIALKAWQHIWNENNTGRYTYDLIPKVGTRVTFLKEQDTGMSYSRMLLHDTMLSS